MKNFKFDKNKKSFILSLLLLVAVVGTASTVALAVATSDKVTNTFQAADNNTDIVEPGNGNPNQKKVSIKNSSLTSATFVRARVTVSPEGACTYTIPAGTGWKDGGDGFYYYCEAVPKEGSTTNLLDGVTPTNQYDTFDVTVYEESCVATVTTDVGLDIVKDAFAQAVGNGTVKVIE